MLTQYGLDTVSGLTTLSLCFNVIALDFAKGIELIEKRVKLFYISFIKKGFSFRV
jgi:hypothetical protein